MSIYILTKRTFCVGGTKRMHFCNCNFLMTITRLWFTNSPIFTTLQNMYLTQISSHYVEHLYGIYQKGIAITVLFSQMLETVQLLQNLQNFKQLCGRFQKGWINIAHLPTQPEKGNISTEVNSFESYGVLQQQRQKDGLADTARST